MIKDLDISLGLRLTGAEGVFIHVPHQIKHDMLSIEKKVIGTTDSVHQIRGKSLDITVWHFTAIKHIKYEVQPTLFSGSMPKTFVGLLSTNSLFSSRVKVSIMSSLM